MIEADTRRRPQSLTIGEMPPVMREAYFKNFTSSTTKSFGRLRCGL